MPGAYDDNLSDDELKLVDAHLTGSEVPPADDQDGSPEDTGAAPAPTPSPTPAPAPAPTPAPAPAAAEEPGNAQTQPQQTEDEKFAAFMDQHKDKSPEEIARLAFQQSQRAERTGFQQRQTQQTLEALQTRVTAAAERAAKVRESIATRRAQFDEKLNSDPDGAAKDIHDRLLTEEERQAEEDERNARIEAAFGLAAAAIPDFRQQAPAIFAFGGEMGYSKEEMASISDGRDLVTLSLARMAANLIKGGVMDTTGKLLLEMPKAIDNTDPRLQAPEPHKTLSSAPARSAGGGKTAEQMGMDVLNLSDEDFAKLPPGELESLLKQLNG